MMLLAGYRSLLAEIACVLAAAHVAAVAAADDSPTPRSSTEWWAPHTIENPFFPAKPRASSDRSAEVVDGNLPVVYRLPPIAPDETEPERDATGELESPAEVVAPPNHVVAPPLVTPLPPLAGAAIPTPLAPPRHDPPPAERLETDDAGYSEAPPAIDHPAATAKDLAVDEQPIEQPTPAGPAEAPPLEGHRVSPQARLYTPTTMALSSQLTPAVERGYALAQRGAMFAAHTEFVGVLRRIAQAKDAQRGTDRHSRALAEGLRALDEAKDFVPPGNQLEAELCVRIVTSAHRTPVLRDRPDNVLPHEAAALYHTYAEERLALAVDREEAGSMVLYGLGKVQARLAERDGDLHAARSAMTMYRAALEASPANHLAANELGVLLCRNGHAADAARLFEQAIDVAPTATAYHNLAVAQQELGLHQHAAANQRESHRLAAWERASGAVSRRVGVEWVSPEQMVGVPPPKPSPWQRTKDIARALPLPGARSSTTPPDASPTLPATQWR